MHTQRTNEPQSIATSDDGDSMNWRDERKPQGARITINYQPTTAPAPSSTLLTAYRAPVALAGLQILLGYAWLVAGVDELLIARFPAMLGALLSGTLRNVPAPFAAILQAVVIPNAAAFGVLAEWGQQLTGLGLIAAGVTALAALPLQRRLPAAGARLVVRFQRVVNLLWPIAAIAGLLMGVSFYLVDGAPGQGFMPSTAFGGALDEAFLLALGSVVLLIAAIAPYRSRPAAGAEVAKSRRLSPASRRERLPRRQAN